MTTNDPLKLYSLLLNIRSALEIKMENTKSKTKKMEIALVISRADQTIALVRDALDKTIGELDE